MMTTLSILTTRKLVPVLIRLLRQWCAPPSARIEIPVLVWSEQLLLLLLLLLLRILNESIRRRVDWGHRLDVAETGAVSVLAHDLEDEEEEIINLFSLTAKILPLKDK